jgi:ABC-type Fe3+ transport system permease subunit
LTGSQFPYLTYMVFTGYNSPEPQYHYLAYDAALILVVIVMLLLVLSRIIVARTQRHAESSRSTGGGLRARMRARAKKNEPLLGITGAPPR